MGNGMVSTASNGSLGMLYETAAIELIKASALFDETWYQATYPDVVMLGMPPIEHYLRVGALLGRDPGPGFSTNAYLRANRDVAEAGMNPLYHYVLYGRSEGRELGKGERSVGFYRHRLWAGFSRQALQGLMEYERSEQPALARSARWALAQWFHAHGESVVALDLLRRRGDAPTQSELVAEAKCLSCLARTDELAPLLEHTYADVLGDQRRYVLLNWLNGQPERMGEWLALINELFDAHDLLPLMAREPTRPLALGNLTTGRSVEERHPIKGPLVTVIVPAYNAESSIRIALNGLLEQTWKNLEVIVVDDASEDSTAAIVEALQFVDPRVRLIRHTANRGAYPARNTGARAATGDFIAVHDSDDWSHPQKIERQMAALLSDPHLAVTYSDWVRVDKQLVFVGPWLLSGRFVEKNHSSTLLRRSVFEALGGWDEVNVGGDTEYLWRIEAVYGRSAIRSVLPGLPLSFSLAASDSLTRHKATHVKTIHFGLRRLYREAAQWWHRSNEVLHVGANDGRRFPAPTGNLRGCSDTYDVLALADCSVDNPDLERFCERIVASHLARGAKVAIFHWPVYEGRWNAPVADSVFELCQRQAVALVSPGDSFKAPLIVVADSRLLEFPVDALPRVHGIEQTVLEKDSANTPAVLVDSRIRTLLGGAAGSAKSGDIQRYRPNREESSAIQEVMWARARSPAE
ncbi:hypothetical protein CAI21_13915 [Alkalilimnicola ehrlichii]|uniref:Glycosyltransferase 2-like domain-containing protein n=1 Tax=Alkalilimnicola ehrlichii TaxID=351052 RepID=A0A3E0WPB7_9GAMM|nr:glycosyltransferase family A protein [Alkalilimnicola ehrlichii]RFA28007.1 hypothetical protein CAI21_13915 [Alkalilimnicola ehrlichii]RFA34658.1 hypothetical protein CAL65_14955 [Alkalilimnicola ehrlichii]